MTAVQPVAPVRGGPIVADNITEEIAAFCVAATAETLPLEVMEAAPRLLLDYAGVTLRGSLEPSSRAAARAVARLSPAGAEGCTMVGYSGRVNSQYAALLNGVSAHGLELDDTHPHGGIHLGATMFSAALAIGEQVDAPGEAVLAAAVVGYEVAARLSMALPLAAHSGHGFHATGTCGTFGAAATASHMLGLSIEQTMNALGIAGSQAAASLEYRAEGAWTKRLHPGWAAHCGIAAATLAAAGFTGPRRIIEGKAGFLRSYSDSPEPDTVLAGLGRDYQITRTAIKPHAACRHSQAAIDATIQLATSYDLGPADVERITVRIFTDALPSVAEPAERKRRPQSMADAQFNIFFAVAGALMWRDIDIGRYQPESYRAPEMLALIDRIACVGDPALDGLFPSLWPAEVELLLRDGRHVSARIDHPLGDPENPLSDQSLRAKFDALAANLLPQKKRQAIIAAADVFAGQPVRSFMRLLSLDS